MRYVAPIRVALLGVGLALAVPTAGLAGPPDDNCQTCQTCQQKHGFLHKHTVRGPRLCAKCLEAQRQANGGVLMPPPMAIPGTPACAGCQAQAMAMSGGMPTVMMAANGASGYAVMGEPTPVGVMQASYRPAAGAAASGPGHASVGPTGVDPSYWSNSSTTTLAAPRHNPPHILLHLFGMRDPESPWASWHDKARQQHAAIGYGPYDNHVTELPASVVYGGR
jgi:hypothetical protein